MGALDGLDKEHLVKGDYFFHAAVMRNGYSAADRPQSAAQAGKDLREHLFQPAAEDISANAFQTVYRVYRRLRACGNEAYPCSPADGFYTLDYLLPIFKGLHVDYDYRRLSLLYSGFDCLFRGEKIE